MASVRGLCQSWLGNVVRVLCARSVGFSLGACSGKYGYAVVSVLGQKGPTGMVYQTLGRPNRSIRARPPKLFFKLVDHMIVSFFPKKCEWHFGFPRLSDLLSCLPSGFLPGCPLGNLYSQLALLCFSRSPGRTCASGPTGLEVAPTFSSLNTYWVDPRPSPSRGAFRHG